MPMGVPVEDSLGSMVVQRPGPLPRQPGMLRSVGLLRARAVRRLLAERRVSIREMAQLEPLFKVDSEHRRRVSSTAATQAAVAAAGSAVVAAGSATREVLLSGVMTPREGVDLDTLTALSRLVRSSRCR